MKHSTTDGETKTGGAIAQFAKILILMTLLVVAAVTVFLNFYTRYNDRILYAERLSQMKDVTAQLFSGLEDVVGNQWTTADVLCNYVEVAKPADADTLQRFMQKQAVLNDLDSELDSLIAVDSHGRYYTQDGMAGTLQELNYLMDNPERISFVSNTVTTNRTKMVFLERLATPVQMTVGERPCELIYYGFTRDMTELEPYFDCAAYEGSNGVYVVDEDGLKLFNSQGSSGVNGELIKGYNVYNVLETMEYKHDTTFDDAKAEMQQNGMSYSNAVLNGEEYYYALYRMDRAEWTLVFLVKSNAVAQNTVELVNTTVRIVLVFAVAMAAVCALVIFWVLRRQQQRELAAAEKSNAQLSELNAKLENAVKTTKAALQTAESANRAKSEFLSSMSHDIRTPMNAIVGITTLMENEIDKPDKLRAHIEKLRGSGDHLLGLINDILDMNKIESGKTVLNVERMNLADQLTNINDIIRPQMKEHHHNYVVRTENIVHENLYGDPTRLRQVLINIISNSVKYTKDYGTIEFTICERPREGGQYARYAFNITDNGIGMSEEYLQHIYDSFSRAESTMTNRVQGSGLGMAITKSIVDAMGGTIRVESAIGKGTHFEVVLDFKIDAEADQNIKEMDVLVITAADRTLARIMDATSAVPVHVEAVATFAEGIAYLQQHDVDAVLTPYDKQEGDTSKKIAEMRTAAGKPIVVLGMADLPTEEAIDRVKAAGLDGYISTPFFLSHLVREVNRVREEQAATDTDTADGSLLTGMKFLCAEDNALNAEILEALLEMSGASCTIYSDGVEIVKAFENVKPGDYDAILMDVQMPNMNGIEATKVIRSSDNPLARTIPIIAMTANAFSEDVERCLNAGMDAHMAKPVNMETLEKTVRKFRVGGVNGTEYRRRRR